MGWSLSDMWERHKQAQAIEKGLYEESYVLTQSDVDAVSKAGKVKAFFVGVFSFVGGWFARSADRNLERGNGKINKDSILEDMTPNGTIMAVKKIGGK